MLYCLLPLAMLWNGQFRFGSLFAVYYGPVDDNDLHQHAAYQLIVARNSKAKVLDKDGNEYCGASLLIPPTIPHIIYSEKPLISLYIEAQSNIMGALLQYINGNGISVVPVTALPFSADTSLLSIIDILNSDADIMTDKIDKRLKNILDELARNPGTLSITQAANEADISASRLRTLVREQLGVPLSTWLLWRKLECAAKALMSGHSFAEAAIMGGFSDQAHFNRTMKNMFGIRPTIAINSLR